MRGGAVAAVAPDAAGLMLENLAKRAAQAAERRAAARRERLAARLTEMAPGGIEVGEEGEQVALSGRGLARRFALDPRLRWLVAEARDDQ